MNCTRLLETAGLHLLGGEFDVSTRPILIGTYPMPAVGKGDRVTCLYRDAECVVTGFHDGRILWPRVRALEQRGGSGLWVNEDMVRAIRTESASALMSYFKISSKTVWNWRKKFDVSGTATTPGSRRAHRVACQAGAEAMKQKEWTEAEMDVKVVAALRCGTRPGPRWTPATGGWTLDEMALLGTDHDQVIAAHIGRTHRAVTFKRLTLRISAFSGNPGNGRPWTKEELRLLGTDQDEAVAEQIGRSVLGVKLKRCELGIALAVDRRRSGQRTSQSPRVGLKWLKGKT